MSVLWLRRLAVSFFGFDTAIISGATNALQSYFGLNNFTLGFTVSVALIGTIPGDFGVGLLAETLGRRRTLILIGLFYLASAVGSAISSGWYEFLMYRFIGGLAVGGASVVAPMYIAEISPAHLRGRLVAINQLNIVSGILLGFFSNYLIGSLIEDSMAWRWMLGVEAAPAAMFLMLLFVIPMSPRWLVRKGRMNEARAVLARIGSEDVEGELSRIEPSLTESGSGKATGLMAPQYRFALFCAWALAMFNTGHRQQPASG